jgi:hypothetical protein
MTEKRPERRSHDRAICQPLHPTRLKLRAAERSAVRATTWRPCSCCLALRKRSRLLRRRTPSLCSLQLQDQRSCGERFVFATAHQWLLRCSQKSLPGRRRTCRRPRTPKHRAAKPASPRMLRKHAAGRCVMGGWRFAGICVRDHGQLCSEHWSLPSEPSCVGNVPS